MKVLYSNNLETVAEVLSAAVRRLRRFLDRALEDSYLTGANLGGADLTGAYLKSANLDRAHLSGAHLSDADLTGANLSGADLTGANLGGADLTGANLGGADLTGANLSGADLSGADLCGAYLGNSHRAATGAVWVSGYDGHWWWSCVAEAGQVLKYGCEGPYLLDAWPHEAAAARHGEDRTPETRALVAYLSLERGEGDDDEEETGVHDQAGLRSRSRRQRRVDRGESP